MYSNLKCFKKISNETLTCSIQPIEIYLRAGHLLPHFLPANGRDGGGGGGT